MKHAEIKVSVYKIPLIGIPAEASIEECDLCHTLKGLTDIEYKGVQFLCSKCQLDLAHNLLLSNRPPTN